MKKVLLLVMVLCLGLAGITSADQGKVLYKYWGDIPGTAIADLTAALDPADPNIVRYPDNPDWTQLRNMFEAPLDYADNFGAELSGWLVPKTSGSYAFWIASDDASELWISTNLDPANAQRIAWINSWGPSRNFRIERDGVWVEPDQGPKTVSLEAGKAYYIMARYKEGGGGDNCSVAWAPASNLAAQGVLGEADPSIIWSNDPRVCSSPTPGSPIALDSVLGWVLPMAAYVPEPILNVHFGTDPEALDLMIENGEAPTSFDPGGLEYDTTYYLRVDTVNAPDPNDPETTFLLAGDLWSFTSVTKVPVITAQPQSVKVGEGCAGVFTVAAISGANDDGGDLSYQWKKGDGTALAGETSDTLVIGEAGSYYCTVTNPQGSVDSAQASLTIATHGAAPLNQDVGAPGAAGSFTVDAAGVYRVAGNGSDIWGGSDNFHFVYIPMEGDCEISARVVDIENPNNTGQTWVKAGVMIRDELVGNSLHAFMAATTGNGTAWQGRKGLGDNNGNSSGHDGGGKPTPRWVRVVRQGNQFYGYTSTDGANWTLIPGNAEISNPHTFEMADPVYIGLAVTSHDNGILATGVFDDVKGFGTSWKVGNPSPAPLDSWGPDDWINPDADIVLAWDAAPHGPCGATYNVIWSLDPADLQDPNATPNYVVTDTTATIPAADVDYEQVIYWRVDTYYGGDREIGDVWAFETIKLVPVITMQPADAMGHIGDLVSFSVTATSLPAKPISDYSWYKVGAEEDVLVASGPTLSTLELTVSEATSGTYYVVVGNPDPKVSNTAKLIIYRLLGHWPLDAIGVTGDPDLVEDMSGEMRHGTAIGEPTIVPGVKGNAVELNGVDQWIDIGLLASQLDIQGNRQKSVSAWVNTRGFNNGGIFDLGNRATAQNFSLRTLDTDNRWRIQYWGGDWDFTTTGVGNGKNIAGYEAPTLDTWAHLVLTHDGAYTRIYLNGRLIVNWAKTINTTDGFTFRIGRYGPNNTGTNFNGLIDEVRLYNYALSPTEVGVLYTDVMGGTVCPERPTWDLNWDCKVDLQDFAILAADWLECNLIPCDRW